MAIFYLIHLLEKLTTGSRNIEVVLSATYNICFIVEITLVNITFTL